MNQYDAPIVIDPDDYTQMENRYRELKQFVEKIAEAQFAFNFIEYDANDLLVKIGEWEGE